MIKIKERSTTILVVLISFICETLSIPPRKPVYTQSAKTENCAMTNIEPLGGRGGIYSHLNPISYTLMEMITAIFFAQYSCSVLITLET